MINDFPFLIFTLSERDFNLTRVEHFFLPHSEVDLLMRCLAPPLSPDIDLVVLLPEQTVPERRYVTPFLLPITFPFPGSFLPFNFDPTLCSSSGLFKFDPTLSSTSGFFLSNLSKHRLNSQACFCLQIEV